MRDVFARQQKPDCTANPFRFASPAFARTERTPAASVAMGFSRNACLPAASAAAADQSDLEGVVVGRERFFRKADVRGQNAAQRGGGGRLQKLAARSGRSLMTDGFVLVHG